jgi:hypothetical protein
VDTIEEKFKNMHLLDRAERIKLTRELAAQRPTFLEPYAPKWWWWRRCQVNVLIVCDGGLNYDTGGFGLSEFLTTFNKLESTSWVDYSLTLAHRGTIINSPNPVVVKHISSFNFETSVNLDDFDQVWLFGINSGGSITATEKKTIENYMDGGGGLFATGDHGSLGNTMCGDVARIKDMRYWTDTTTSPSDPANEVSMSGKRRNDTNRPAAGDTTSRWFDNQSDDIPQTIGVRTFGSGMPHPLLSINTSLRPSGIIDVMPDHPHEGECAPETSFTMNGMTIPTQIIATSFVMGGSTTHDGSGKDLTDPHCFPSISVWDGRPASVGRIVVDSTWHHFININLNGTGSTIDKPGIQPGLNASDYTAVQQYYMNIATWMSRRKFMLCWRKYVLFDLFANSQLIEASLNNPQQYLKEISLADLNSIGALAEEILAGKYNPAFARSFLLELMEEYNKGLTETLDIWKPQIKRKKKEIEGKPRYYQDWLNLDLILWTSIGAGFIALRDDKKIASDSRSEKDLERLVDVFIKGVDYGYQVSLSDLEDHYKSMVKSILR